MPEPLDAMHIEYATDKVLADVDTFADWLANECMEQSAVSSNYECRLPARLDAAHVSTLLHAAITSALEGNDMMSGQAVKRIAERYLTYSRARIIDLASQSAMEDKP